MFAITRTLKKFKKFQNFPQPPNYNNRPVRQQIVPNSPNPQQRLQYQQQRALQQQQKERLLQQQQKQSMVVPSNATAGAELCEYQQLFLFHATYTLI